MRQTQGRLRGRGGRQRGSGPGRPPGPRGQRGAAPAHVGKGRAGSGVGDGGRRWRGVHVTGLLVRPALGRRAGQDGLGSKHNRLHTIDPAIGNEDGEKGLLGKHL
ncbi:TPA_asm: UL40.7A [Human alphaherpesvirus 1]|nr:TPA_asm: UL40.7A [Human alphaherpesvirus 1]